MWYPVAGTTVPYLRNCGTRLLEQWCNSGRNLHLLVSMPLLLYSAKNGFSSLVLCTCFLRLAYIVIELIAVKLLLHIGLWKGFSVVLPSVLASIPMVVFGIWQTHTKSNILFDILGIVVCIILYFATCVVIKPIRKDLYGMINTIKAKGN